MTLRIRLEVLDCSTAVLTKHNLCLISGPEPSDPETKAFTVAVEQFGIFDTNLTFTKHAKTIHNIITFNLEMIKLLNQQRFICNAVIFTHINYCYAKWSLSTFIIVLMKYNVLDMNNYQTFLDV